MKKSGSEFSKLANLDAWCSDYNKIECIFFWPKKITLFITAFTMLSSFSSIHVVCVCISYILQRPKRDDESEEKNEWAQMEKRNVNSNCIERVKFSFQNMNISKKCHLSTLCLFHLLIHLRYMAVIPLMQCTRITYVL